MDTVDATTRSRMMSGIRSKNTKPELAVRKFLHANGFRYRIHRKDLPGNPDLVFPKLRLCLFVHGCFWHRHVGCRYTTSPKTRTHFWNEKFQKNVARDIANIQSLETSGWEVLIVWECQLREDENALEKLLAKIEALRTKDSSALEPDDSHFQKGPTAASIA